MDTTLKYYNDNANQFVQGTLFADLRKTQDRFLKELNPGDSILDFGCGSGRDAKYFMESGYKVDATDGSAELCRLASDYAGIPVRTMLFDELDAVEKYDGIWACSSILHLPKNNLKKVFHKMIRALKPNGVIYTSFKLGIFEGEINGRYFTDFTIESFKEFIADIESIAIEDDWITSDVRPGREEEKWLNLMLRKIYF